MAACLALVSPGAAWAGVAGHFATVLDTPAPFPRPALAAGRNAVIVLQPWEGRRAEQLEAFNPRLKVLAYQNLSAMTEGYGPGDISASGVNYAEADLAHPGWFLSEANGQRIAERNYPYLWMANVAVPGYQRKWTANVLRMLRSGPWDGVFMDDTNTTAEYHVAPVSRIAQMPSDAAYQAAVTTILAYAGPRIRAAGMLAVPNFGAWQQYPRTVAHWLRYVSGGVDQQFVKWSPVPGKGYVTPERWLVQMREIETAEDLHRRFFAVTHAAPDDSRAIRFGWGTVLLAARGHTYYFARGAESGETWSPIYRPRLGRPVSVAEPYQGGLWIRRFGRGLVVVNPQESSLPVSFSQRYSGSGLHASLGTTMEAHSALILTRDGP